MHSTRNSQLDMKGKETQTLRVSLWGVVLFISIMIGLGLVGGFVAQEFTRPAPLTGTGVDTPFIPTVQEVTISPSQAAADIVERTQGSVMALGPAGTSDRTITAAGFVITNDGLLATPATTQNLVAYDRDGRVLPLDRIGDDALFGLTYFRMSNNVVAPLDVRQSDSPVGATLWALTRTEHSFQPHAEPYTITHYELPEPPGPLGWQRIMRGTPTLDATFTGSPLIDEEGRLAGLILDPAEGRALTIEHIQESFQRVTANQREHNPWQDLGIVPTPQFQAQVPDGPVSFSILVSTVTPQSRAATAGLKPGDMITAIQNTPLVWQTSVLKNLATPLPLTLKVIRQGAEHTLTLQP